jgi:hypothetical protein
MAAVTESGAATSKGVEDDPFAAALVAASELAKSGGALLLNPLLLQELVASSQQNCTAISVPTAPGGQKNAPATFPKNSLSPNLAAMIAAAAAAATTTATAGQVYSQASTLPSTVFGPSVSPPPAAAVSTTSNQHKYASEVDEDDDDEDEASFGDEDGNGNSQNEEDAERRVARSRERNREHARRTRLRKKAQLEALQSKVKGLQAESKILKQSLEECSIATILVGLSSGNERDATIQALVKEATEIEAKEIFKVVGGKRKRFLSDASSSSSVGGDQRSPSHPLEIKINGKPTIIGGGRTHINWKSGLYSDENGVQCQLTHKQLESLRRERNRMHAKMTRDRKKNFIATVQKTIEQLESTNQRMKMVLADVIQNHFKSNPLQVPAGVTPTASPTLIPEAVSVIQVPSLAPALPVALPSATISTTESASAPLVEEISSVGSPQAPKRVPHGFSSPIY